MGIPARKLLVPGLPTPLAKHAMRYQTAQTMRRQWQEKPQILSKTQRYQFVMRFRTPSKDSHLQRWWSRLGLDFLRDFSSRVAR